MEIRKIKQVLKKLFLRSDVTLGSLMKTCDFSRRFDEGALDWPPSVPEYFTVVIAREKIIRRGKNHFFSHLPPFKLWWEVGKHI